jgi:ABC-type cobalamin/Fe3+-siderophores transport system ATPase subunit
MTDKFISIEGITKRFAAPGRSTIVFDDLWLSMARGEFVCIIGHSGCGKTTVLNILAGLDVPSAGAVIVDNEAIEGPSLDRAIFQVRAAAVAHGDGQRHLCGGVEWRFMSRKNLHRQAQIRRPRRSHRGRAQAPVGAVRRHEAAGRHRALSRSSPRSC